MKLRAILVGLLSMASAAHGAIVIDPVPTPIAPGIKVGLTFVGQVPASGDPVVDGYRSRLQQLRAVPDGSGRLFVNDTRGTISVVSATGGTPKTWFDIRGAVAGFSNASNAGQTGLMSFAFHPNFAGDPDAPGYGVFYTIDTSAPSGRATLAGKGPGGADHDNIVHEFRVADPRAATASIESQREVLRVAQPLSDHGPGTIAFNPLAAPGSADYGKLYIGFGDGGGVGDPYGNAQDLGSPLGKILRIDPARGARGEAYTVPADNPYVGVDGARPEVWAAGLRNPQQFGWDSDTKRMLITDIGQSQLEEVNVGTKGANYGWPLREGTFARGASYDPNVYDDPNTGGYVDPVAQFDHEEIKRSGVFPLAAISSAFAYTGSAVPELAGMTIVSELVSGRVFYYESASATTTSQAVLRELGLTIDGMDTTLAATDGNRYFGGRVDLRMGQDDRGEVYLLTKDGGNIYRFASLLSVPEPETWLMLILGFGLAGGVLRRRRIVTARLA